MKKIIISLSIGSMLLTGGNAKAVDFDSLPIKEKNQIMKTQQTLISYGEGVNKKEIRITKHQEDKRNLSKKQQYKIYENTGNFKKGSRYKLTYKGDYIVKIKKL
ncbi:hypothetical protein vBSscSF1_51 [Staphylococcus phage vB-SscS-F1]|nr:hypothetical protein vBApySJF1_51 [Arcanobacterium phage vB-ApyS-JF1]